MSIKTDNVLRLVVTQPMLMPWHGMFSQMMMADRILIYDDVQLPHGGGASRGFMTRVQVKSHHGIDWLTVPVQRAGHRNQRICDVKIVDNDWRSKHLSKIQEIYKKAPYFNDVFEHVVAPIYQNKSENLSDFLIESMKIISSFFAVAATFERTSRGVWSNELSGTDRLIEICRQVGASDYISGHGGMNYIDYEQFEKNGVKINYLLYKIKEYKQVFEGFTPYLSIIDLLFCVGLKNARTYLETDLVYWRDWPQKINGRPTKLT